MLHYGHAIQNCGCLKRKDLFMLETVTILNPVAITQHAVTSLCLRHPVDTQQDKPRYYPGVAGQASKGQLRLRHRVQPDHKNRTWILEFRRLKFGQVTIPHLIIWYKGWSLDRTLIF